MNLHVAPSPSQSVETPVFKNAAAVAFALQPDEPVLCFSAPALHRQAQIFKDNFQGQVAYAVKANPLPQIIRQLHGQGINIFDVASPAEMALVKRHAPRAKLHYHNPVKSCVEISSAYHGFSCKRFAVDTMEELQKIAEIIGDDCHVEIAVRFCLPTIATSVHDFSSKFGATPKEAVLLLRTVASLGFIPLLTFHPGSQCHDVNGWVHHIKAAARIEQESCIKLAGVNIGGGFAVTYKDAQMPELTRVFQAINFAVTQHFGDDHPPLECEPGRALVAPCMSLLTRVKLVRQNSVEVFLNDGIYGNLMEAGQAPKLTPRHRVLKKTLVPHRDYTIFGPTCDPLDRLPNKISLPINIAEGDYIEFQSVGAYGAATATQFNGYGNAELIEVTGKER